MFTIQFGSYTFPNQTFVVDSLPIGMQSKETNIPRMHGSVMPTFYLKSRSIKIKGKIHNDSLEDSLTQLLSMQNALLNGEQALYLRSDRYIKAKLFDMDTQYEEGTDKRVLSCSLSFKAATPLFYSAGASYTVVQSITGTTVSFNVVNGGNVFVEPKIYICATGGTITDGIKLTNLSDANTFLRYRDVLPAGQTLTIDSDQLTVLVNGVDGLSGFEGNFLNVVPGTNSFQFVGSNCTVTVENKYRWYD